MHSSDTNVARGAVKMAKKHPRWSWPSSQPSFLCWCQCCIWDSTKPWGVKPPILVGWRPGQNNLKKIWRPMFDGSQIINYCRSIFGHITVEASLDILGGLLQAAKCTYLWIWVCAYNAAYIYIYIRVCVYTRIYRYISVICIYISTVSCPWTEIPTLRLPLGTRWMSLVLWAPNWRLNPSENVKAKMWIGLVPQLSIP